MADRDLKTVLYTADDGTQYRTKQDNAIVAQQNGDGDPITGAVVLNGADSHQELPKGLMPRGVYVNRTGSKQRFVVCMTPTAPLYNTTVATPVSTVDLQQLGGAAATYTRTKAKSEKDHRKAAKNVGS